MSTRRSTSLFAVCALVVFPLLFGAKGGCGGDVVIGDDECAKSACGAMPALACADGSSAYTGRCLGQPDGTCAWEKRSCPAPTSCEPCAVPDIACADGSIPYTGKCFLDPSGKCTAEYKGCPGECTKAECGPELGMPSYTCEDGTTGGPTGRCLRDAAGKCAWEVKDCPKACTAADCGPIPDHVACPDGTAPPTTCKRKSDGTCAWDIAACPVSSCDMVTKVSRACTTASDCTYGVHQTDCCGSTHAIGISTSAASSFASEEKACDATYPACGCAAQPTVDDSGKPGTAFAVDCVSGVCTTHVTTGI